MDNKTSFIPKKTLTTPVYRESGPGIFSFVSLMLLIISGLILGGVYFYKSFLNKKIDTLFDSLKRAEDILDPVFIGQMQSIDRKIETAKILLAEHKMPTAIFDFLEQSTLKSVRFKSFDFSIFPSKDLNAVDEVSIKLDGVAKGYAPLALQTREFQKNEYVKNVLLSNLSLGEGGEITFSAVIMIDLNHLIFNPN
ncbi:hypothetical protein KJ763_00530 [Patescibacteria group bacterium]|nr:hypothetical protein [Patescibacteria group bacterium]